jgi:VanZ family protein
MNIYAGHPSEIGLENYKINRIIFINFESNMFMIKNNILSIFVALVIAYLSLSGSKKFEDISPFSFVDKIVHTCMYFGFMGIILFENRKRLLTIKQLLIAGLIPFSYGVLMEVLQATITTDRSGSVFDALFNTAGILICIFLWHRIKPFSGKSLRL